MKSAGRTPGWGPRGSCSILRVSGCRKRGASLATCTLRRPLLPLPRRGELGRLCSLLPHHSATPGAGPGDPTSGTPDSRSCEAGLEGSDNGGGRGLSIAGQRRCRLRGYPGATSQAQVQVPSCTRGAKVPARHDRLPGCITAGVAQALRRWDKAAVASSSPRAVFSQVSARSGSQTRALRPWQRAQASESGLQTA